MTAGAGLTKLEICSKALVLLGAEPLQSFYDKSLSATLCKEMFPIIYSSCLSDKSWHFAERSIILSKNVSTPLYNFKYSFQLPADFIRLSAISVAEHRQTYTDFKLEGNSLYSNCDALYLTYIAEVPTEDLPSFFIEYLIYSLCGSIVMSLYEDVQKVGYFQSLAEKFRTRARTIDSKNTFAKGQPLTSYGMYATRLR